MLHHEIFDLAVLSNKWFEKREPKKKNEKSKYLTVNRERTLDNKVHRAYEENQFKIRKESHTKKAYKSLIITDNEP